MLAQKLLTVLLLAWNHELLVSGQPAGHPLVETSQGLIRGRRATDGDYDMFLGIPYATVDKTNYFKNSLPHPKFETVFDAIDDSAQCPQFDFARRVPIGTIDCLHLNVFVPRSASIQKPVPVFVYIHGGRFKRGQFGRYRLGPKFLVRHDIIIVTINSRVGPYGFMCLDIPEVPGNAGLKDQQAALRWVKKNIAAFGGDPNKITLAGNSAGGASVDFQFLFNKEDVFNQVMFNSGVAQCPWTIIDSDRNEPIEIAEKLGFKTNDFRAALDYIATMDPHLVIDAKTALGSFSRVCVEKEFENVERLVSDFPINVRPTRAQNTPILSGYTEDEMTFEYLRYPMEFFENPEVFADELSLMFNFGNMTQDMGRFYKHFYVGETLGEKAKLKIIDFESDLRFNHPIHRTLKTYLNEGNQNIYQYFFTYIGGRNVRRVQNNITIGGATHGDEVGYLFESQLLQGRMSPQDQVVVDRMTTMWANFVKYGNPTPETSELLPVKWIPISNSSFTSMEIGNDLRILTRVFNKRLTFWDFFHKMNRHFERGFRPQN